MSPGDRAFTPTLPLYGWCRASNGKQAASRYEPNPAEGLVLQGDALSKCDHILSLQDVPRFQANLGFSSRPERTCWCSAKCEVTAQDSTAALHLSKIDWSNVFWRCRKTNKTLRHERSWKHLGWLVLGFLLIREYFISMKIIVLLF